MSDLTPAELIAEMNTGWNLGNSLDAFDGKGLDTETSWGNPKTTKEMIDTISGRGFNTIRIPVTWGPHMGEAPEYLVDEAWMDRVQEVVDYASAKTSDTEAFARYFRFMLEHGFSLAPSQFEAMFISCAHDDAMLDETLSAIADFLAKE